MTGDAEVFYQRVCWSGGSTRPDCAEDPILASLSPNLFVDRLIECTPDGQRVVLEALKERYAHGRLANELAAECKWLLDVDIEIDGRMPDLPRIRQYSLSKDSARLLGHALAQAREAIAVTNIPTAPEAVDTASAI